MFSAFADVYSAIDRRSEEQVAIKVIRNKFIEDRKYITREINVHFEQRGRPQLTQVLKVFNNCHHRNLVNLYHCFYFESQIWVRTACFTFIGPSVLRTDKCRWSWNSVIVVH